MLNEKYPYDEIKKNGKNIEKKGWHKPRNCNCKKTTSKGAYRDEIYEYDGKIVIYYHQNCITVVSDNKMIIDNCGYYTKTTKERLNSYLSKYVGHKFAIIQRDFEWYVTDMSKAYNDRFSSAIYENGMEFKRRKK